MMIANRCRNGPLSGWQATLKIINLYPIGALDSPIAEHKRVSTTERLSNASSAMMYWWLGRTRPPIATFSILRISPTQVI